jgi:hypothetical protein
MIGKRSTRSCCTISAPFENPLKRDPTGSLACAGGSPAARGCLRRSVEAPLREAHPQRSPTLTRKPCADPAWTQAPQMSRLPTSPRSERQL